MKKTFLVFLTFILFSSFVSAVEISGNDKVLRGENLVIKISGNFYQPLTKEDLTFYRRHMPTSFGVIDLISIEGDYYFYILIQDEKVADNYSLVLENIKENVGNQVVESSPYFNFSILDESASFSISSGILFAEKNYSFEITNLNSKEIEIDYYFDDFSEDYFSNSSGNETNETSSTSFSFWDWFSKPTGEPTNDSIIPEGDGKIILKSGEIKEVNFETYHIGFKEIAFVHEGKYQKILVYSTLEESELPIIFEENITEDEEETPSFWDLFKKKETNSSLENETTIDEDNETWNVEELKTCDEMNGRICNSTSICSGKREDAKNGPCCLGECIPKPDKETGKIIGWVIIIVIILFVAWFFQNKFKKVKESPVDLEREIEKSEKKKFRKDI